MQPPQFLCKERFLCKAAAERMMYRALREMEAVEAANVGRIEPARPGVDGRLGSFFPEAGADPEALGPMVARASSAAPGPPEPAATAHSASRSETPGGSSYVPITIGRVG